jgi:hypothetical protein
MSGVSVPKDGIKVTRLTVKAAAAVLFESGA